MAKKLSAGLLFGCCNFGGCARIATVFLMLLSISGGFDLGETTRSSSQRHSDKPNISIRISESVKETKTAERNDLLEDVGGKDFGSILSTELLTNSSYASESGTSSEEGSKFYRHSEKIGNAFADESIKTVDKATEGLAKDSATAKDYYEAIQPTKTVSNENLKILQTAQDSGEEQGVSMMESRPQKSTKASYNRSKRGFGNSSGEYREERTVKQQEEKRKRKEEMDSPGKGYNQIAQTLEKIAKVTVNNETTTVNKSTVAPIAFRERREEENRKASPDIQDIITGIVNILNGKGTKQSESHPTRPRPTSTRINNRGPPRISDVPPLDFDGPPAYRPLPPKRVPPPYTFDIPPSMPNIALPPQPHKNGVSKLPHHPFIDGVPLPEIIIPNNGFTNKPPVNRLPEYVHVSYDGVAGESYEKPTQHFATELNTTANSEIIPATPVAATNNKNVTKPETTHINEGASQASTNKTDVKAGNGKVKPTGQRPQNGPNKNGNKRVRPGPANQNGNKPNANKPATPSPLDDRNRTAVTEINERPVEKATNDSPPKKPETNAKNVTESATEATGTSKEPFGLNITSLSSIKPPGPGIGENSTVRQNATAEAATAKIVVNNETKYEIDLELPLLLDPSIGIGEATPVLESSIPELSLNHSTTSTTALSSPRPTQSTLSETTHHFKARPGIVLDDPEYKPGAHKRPQVSVKPIVTAPPPHSYYGDIFDVTVHAIQGPGDSSTGKPYIVPVDMAGAQIHNTQVIKGDVAVITKPEEGQKFVSIDGKRTYINLFGDVTPTKVTPTTTLASIIGTGYAVPHKETPLYQATVNGAPISTPPSPPPPPPRRPYKKPSRPPIRIDTCIVGDDSTCDSAQNEMCRTEEGVSSCHCRPGYNRKKHRDSCRRVVSMLTSMRIDRLYDKKVMWQENLRDPESEDYQQISYEASQAIESAMSMTPFSDDFINSRINSIYVAKNLENNEPAVYVNLTIQLEENFETLRPPIKKDIQRHLLRVIQRRNNNVGNSGVWVDAPPGSILALQDVNECSSAELHDCHESATCLNTFGSFRCQCPNGLRDPWVGNIHREGRFCESCPSDYCNGRGECKFEHGQQVCHCQGSFYGSQCEIDGEVLGVAIGASVAAAIIIVLTLVCLCMWSRRWSREQKSAVGAGMGSPVFGYMATGPTVKTPNVGAPPYQVSIEDRIRWAQIADVMAKANHYAQPEPVNANKGPAYSSYPTLQSHSMTGTLPLPAITPPVPLPRLTLTNKPVMGTYGAHSQLGSIHQSNHGIRSSLETTSSSEEEDRADLLGRNFNVPRPKSRTSVANQSGIYYDVDFDRSDAYSKQNTIPMNTYSLNSQSQRPYFR